MLEEIFKEIKFLWVLFLPHKWYFFSQFLVEEEFNFKFINNNWKLEFIK